MRTRGLFPAICAAGLMFILSCSGSRTPPGAGTIEKCLPVELPGLDQFVESSQRGDDALPHVLALSSVLDDLEVDVIAGFLVTGEHATTMISSKCPFVK